MPFVLKHTGQGEINLQDHPIPLIEEGQLLVDFVHLLSSGFLLTISRLKLKLSVV